jgi:hypothetical protein
LPTDIPPANSNFSKSSLTVTVADGNGNSMPTGTIIAITAGDNTPAAGSPLCAMFSGSNTVVPNTLTPWQVTAVYTGCEKNDLITVKVTSPLGFVTSQTYTVP